MKKFLTVCFAFIGLFMLAGCEKVNEKGSYKEGTYYGSTEYESYGAKYVTSAVVYVNENDGTPKNKTDYDSLTDKTDYLLVNTGRGDVYCTNSSAFAQQVFIGDDKHIDTAWDFLNFLNQDHAMTIVQTGLDLAYETPKLRLCTYTFKFGWVWEYITNNGAQNAIYTAKGRGENDTYQTAYDDWVSKLHDSMNNYLSFSVKIAY